MHLTTTHRMCYLGLAADGRERWRGTGWATAPGAFTAVWRERWRLVRNPQMLAEQSPITGTLDKWIIRVACFCFGLVFAGLVHLLLHIGG